MLITCKNCNDTYKGNYCPNCGQPAETHKLNFHFLLHDIQHGIFHFDNGIFYSIAQLFKRPGHTIREYLQGKRVKHFKPISMVVILATIYGLLIHFFDISLIKETLSLSSSYENFIKEKSKDWIEHHYAWATLLTLPIYTLASFLIFRKLKYNYIEHLVLNSFAASQRLVIHIIAIPFQYYFFGKHALEEINWLLVVFDFILIYWTYAQFFNSLSKAKALALTFFSYVATIIIYLVVYNIFFGVFYALTN